MSTTIVPKAPTMPTQHSKREQLTEKLQSLKLHGYIVTWMMSNNRGIKNEHTDVVSALQAAGLDEKMARKFLPAQAFNRACNRLREERVIDVIRNDKNDILFQFSKRGIAADKVEGGEEIEYKKETKILLNKTTGELSCKDSAILEQAKAQLDRCMEERTTSDVSFIVNRLFEDNADLIPIGTGVYFISLEHSSYIDKIAHFLGLLGRKIRRFPVPDGETIGDKSVQEVVENHLESMLDDLQENMDKFTVETKMDTVATIAQKINTVKEKVKAYSTYLKDKSDSLLTFVARVNDRLVERVEELHEERKGLPANSKNISNRQRVFDCLSSTVAKSIKELCAQAKTNTNGIGVYLEGLVEKGVAIKTGDGCYQLKD